MVVMRGLLRCVVVITSFLILIGCGGGAENSDSETPAPITTPVLYSTVLQWSMPSTRSDGISIAQSDLAGYRIYMGSTESTLQLISTIENPQTLTFTVSDLAAGSYYFAVSTYDKNGLESSLSNTIKREF